MHGVLTRTYSAPGMSPKMVLDFYTEALSSRGWSVATAVAPEGRVAYAGVWSDGNLKLRVSSTTAPGLEGRPASTASTETQYSLELSGTV